MRRGAAAVVCPDAFDDAILIAGPHEVNAI